MKVRFTIALLLFLPVMSWAQPAEMKSFHQVLSQLYQEMMPLCSRLINVGRGLAGFAALWYIGSRVWRHIANAEPIDFYPLLRPFVLGFCILIFPSVITMINAVLGPTVSGTEAMLDGPNRSIEFLLKKKEEAINKSPLWQIYVGVGGSGDFDKWYEYTYGEDDDNWPHGMGDYVQFEVEKTSYNFRHAIKQWLSEILYILYEAAALCINTIRTFYLIVLAILGPLVFGFAVFDGLQNSLILWLARYINVFLWLPVANIFGSIIGKIQENMLMIDIKQIETYGDTFFSTSDTAYLVFMVIGIVGYFTVPSISNYIVHAAGGGNYLMSRVSHLFTNTITSATSATSSSLSTLSERFSSGDRASSAGKDDPAEKKRNGYMRDKLTGKS